VLSLIPHDMQYGPQAALIAEAFTPRLRYSGASLGISSRPSSLAVRRPLLRRPCSRLSIRLRDFRLHRACASKLVAASFMPDYTGQDISMEYDD